MIKRVLSMLLALVLLCGLLPAGVLQAEAAEAYELYVYGVQVTESNKYDILKDETARYDPVRNELILRQGHDDDTQIAVDNRIPGLRIWLYTDIQTVAAECAIKSSADLTISTIGLICCTLTCEDGAKCICMTDGASLTVEDAYLCALSDDEAFVGSEGSALTLRRSILSTQAVPAVTGFDGGISFVDCSVAEPGAYQIVDGTVMNANGTPSPRLDTKFSAQQFALYVDGYAVHALNKNDVLNDGGSVKYNPKTKTLTINDPAFSGRAGWILASDIDGLTIKGSADCRGSYHYGTWMLAKTKINGDFTIYNSTNEDYIGAAILSSDALEFAGGKILLNGTEFGVYSEGPITFSGGTVTIDSVLTALYSLGGIKLTGIQQMENLYEGFGDCVIYTQKNNNGVDFWIVIEDSEGLPVQYMKIAPGNPFVDVKKSDSYYNAVIWAVSHKPYQVTAGIDKTHFGPDRTVTRAQAMVFFWAAKDRPKFKKASTQFVDVKKSDWYYKAVMWAVEKGITAGTDATHFSPNKTCNRGEILTFLYAAMNKPKVKIKNPYKDVTNQWYKKAALWAYQNGIEKGEKGKFNASTPCTRASTVTYLYRFLTGYGLAE